MLPQTALKVAIFDLDGTLIDTADDLAASMNHALARAGLPAIDGAAVRGLVGSGAEAMLREGFRLAAGREASAGEIERGLENFIAYYEGHIADRSRPFEGVLTFIAWLRDKGCRTAVCTNKREALARQLLEALDISQLFDVIVGRETASAPKPDPAPVRLCIERTGATSGFFFGDSDTDIKAARAAGTPCYIARFGYGPVKLAAEATMFDSYIEATDLVRRDFRF